MCRDTIGERIQMAKHNKKAFEKVGDDELLEIIDMNMRNSVGGFTNSSDLADRREKSTYEFGLQPTGHLAPIGVSSIVASDTVEVIEGYSAIIIDLLLDNNKLAEFIPLSMQSQDKVHQARMASDITNYCMFNRNTDGWLKLSTWIKSSLLYGNGIISWGWMEDYEYVMEEYEEIDQMTLDQLLSDTMVEIVGDLELVESSGDLSALLSGEETTRFLL